MKPIRDIIVKVDKNYKDSITLNNGTVILLNEYLRQVKDTVRYGTVVDVPDKMHIDVKPADTLFFHHGIVAETVMGDKPDIPSPYMMDAEEKLYRVPVSKRWPMAYAVIRDGEFQCLDGVCFVRPIVEKKYATEFVIVPGNEKKLKNIGEMAYSSPGLKEKGIDRGTKVIFEKGSEYDFEIDGETLYCMFDRWILGIYADK